MWYFYLIGRVWKTITNAINYWWFQILSGENTSSLVLSLLRFWSTSRDTGLKGFPTPFEFRLQADNSWILLKVVFLRHPEGRSKVAWVLLWRPMQTDTTTSEIPPKYILRRVAWDHKTWHGNLGATDDDPRISGTAVLMPTGTCSWL